jgi:alkanesulfonate monooxygenase SsuD/methylene tetrahydromethanopterin reductase-like flavin-dependent oxidoreductase (luciferase family)
MRAFYFTEAAYPYLPPETEYESVRVTMPNRVFDPKVGADLYHRFMDEWLLADDEGLNVMVNEHHQTPNCLNASGPITLAVLARETRNARLLILGNPISNRDQPLRVAEEMAMIDCFSRGRLECGFVKGVPYEIAAANRVPVRLNDRLWEAHDLIVKAWTQHDGPFSFEGKFFHHRMVNVWPKPYQQPHPPVWIATLSAQSAEEIGRRGHVLATFLAGYKDTPKIWQGYQRGWEAAGRTGPCPLDRLAYTAMIYTGETDAEGRAGAEKLLWYLEQNKVPEYFKNPPGYLAPQARGAIMRTQPLGYRMRMQNKAPNLDEEIAKGTVFCGSPDTVYKQIKTFYEKVGGMGNLLLMGQAGLMEHEETVRGIKLFAREVYPRIKDLGEPGQHLDLAVAA